ncbi:hypothetical protein UJ101_00348 [Flavobacteriaceae bacterium UJ101]|nr:hypothetical protein UJ101_00348 [Flavobacteriaceae bacterium UJ101]
MNDKLVLLIIVFVFLLVGTYSFRKNNSFVKSIGFQTVILLILVSTLIFKIITFSDTFSSYSQIGLIIAALVMTIPRYLKKVKDKVKK